MTHFNGISADIWPLPPRGISVSKTNHRAGVITQWTYLCEADGCFAIAYSDKSEEHARLQVIGHTCPDISGGRGLIPTGKTLIQNMWDEADDALDHLKQGIPYKMMHGDMLQGFIRGIAEVLTFCTVPCFKVTDDVLRELGRRYKMRQGELPFAPTPSYTYNPHLDVARAKAMTDEVKPVKSTRAPIKKVTKQLDKPVELSLEQRNAIRTAYHGGVLSPIEIAAMFKITVERVEAIAGDKPSSSAPVVNIAPMF